jgi:biopolymer transport protein ExbB
MKRLIFLSFFIFLSSVSANEPNDLQSLLEQVKKERYQEKEVLAKREAKFKRVNSKQEELLTNALQILSNEETRSTSLRNNYDTQELEIARQNNILKEKMGALGELDGIIKQIAGDLNVIIDASLVSAQKPNRDKILDTLSDRKELPSLEELEELWILTMDEMVESGKIVTFPGKIITAAGNEIEQNVTRIGVFNAVSAGRFLRNLPGTGKLIEPGRQPGQRFLDMAQNIETSSSGVHAFPIDPTRGGMLALLVQVPDLKNRIEQGGLVGYVIIFIGLIGVLIALERLFLLVTTSRQVKKQLKNKKAEDNPLGRIMQVYEKNPSIDTETLGLKLDEAILKEMPRIQRGLAALALLAAVSPLLGLLGTVTGIIETFQSITLYGTGDPRVMSGGISQALVTTVMGLLVAIPLLLFHSFLSSKSNALIQVLDEKSTAFVAQLSEKTHIKNNV